MEKYNLTINIVSKKALGGKSPRVNDDALQPTGPLARQLNNYKPHWLKPVTVSLVACQMCLWDIR